MAGHGNLNRNENGGAGTHPTSDYTIGKERLDLFGITFGELAGPTVERRW
jgi:hypothetical protein